jgi:hypothetical protein
MASLVHKYVFGWEYFREPPRAAKNNVVQKWPEAIPCYYISIVSIRIPDIWIPYTFKKRNNCVRFSNHFIFSPVIQYSASLELIIQKKFFILCIKPSSLADRTKTKPNFSANLDCLIQKNIFYKTVQPAKPDKFVQFSNGPVFRTHTHTHSV